MAEQMCIRDRYITDLMDYLENNRIIAHYCGFDIMRPLPSYWTYDRFLRQLNNGELKTIMAGLVRQLYELGVVDASFIGLDSTPVMALSLIHICKPVRIEGEFGKGLLRVIGFFKAPGKRPHTGGKRAVRIFQPVPHASVSAGKAFVGL